MNDNKYDECVLLNWVEGWLLRELAWQKMMRFENRMPHCRSFPIPAIGPGQREKDEAEAAHF